MDRELAQQVAYLLRGWEGALMHTLWLMKRHGTEKEFLEHRKAVGHVLAELGVQILYPIYAEYPDLDPTSPTSNKDEDNKGRSTEKASQGENHPDQPDSGDPKS